MRRFSEQLVAYGATLVRINPREARVPRHQIGLTSGALKALQRLAERIGA